MRYLFIRKFEYDLPASTLQYVLGSSLLQTCQGVYLDVFNFAY